VPQIDLNCDMGESFGAYRIGQDEDLIQYISSANIACGWHAGDPMVMDRVVKLAATHGVGVGAHPGYPDLLGFGRRQMDCTPAEIRNYVMYQVGALMAFCTANGVKLRHVKPHGQLYNTAQDNEAVSTAIAEAIASIDPSLMYVALAGPRGGLAKRVGARVGLKVIYEAFADRAYTPEGFLVPRRKPRAVIKDVQEVAKRAVRMARDGKVIAMDGTEIDMKPHTICVHGDSPGAVDMVKDIRLMLETEGVSVKSMGPHN
jgi:5-oxoprolinase (ATP-hydrolysing) subunit A